MPGSTACVGAVIDAQSHDGRQDVALVVEVAPAADAVSVAHLRQEYVSALEGQAALYRPHLEVHPGGAEYVVAKAREALRLQPVFHLPNGRTHVCLPAVDVTLV